MTPLLRLLLPLPLVVALGVWSSARVADRLGEAGAALLCSLAPLLREPQSPAPSLELEGAIPTDLVAAPVAGTPIAPTGKAKKAPGKAHPTSSPVLFVAEAQVLRLASAHATPHGSPVPANAVRPAGLKLSGVAALGIGLQDGDVLTRAVGQSALSSGAVIQAVLVARARRVPVLEGEFWRGSQRWLIRVEQPYLSERHAAEAPTEDVGTSTAALRPPA